jgi:hypothetical protein
MPELIELEQKALSFPVRAKEILIQTPDDYLGASTFFLSIKALRKEIQDTFGPLKEKAFQAHKAIVAEEKRHEQPLIEAEKIVKGIMEKWDAEQAEIARQKEIELRGIAREEEEKRILQEALNAEAEGDTEALKEIEKEMAAPVYVPPVTVQKDVPKVSGVVFRTYWRWKIKDEKLIPREYLMVDEVKLNKIVSAMKDSTKIPGIEVFSVRS